MAPGGVEPPHADSKSAALSAELRGPRLSVARAGSGLGRRADSSLGALVAWRAPPPLDLGVDLRPEEERERREPEPRERDHHRREGAPRLVVRGELARIEREQ